MLKKIERKSDLKYDRFTCVLQHLVALKSIIIIYESFIEY